VAGFSRYHKYSLGTELRQASRAVVLRIIEANGLREGRAEALLQLRGQLEALTLLLRLAKELKAFQSFAAWQHCVEQVVAVSRQNEGWLKQARGQGRAAGSEAVAARSQAAGA